MKINDKAGINATFAALPHLEKVHVLADGSHYFNEAHAKRMAGKGNKFSTLAKDAKELKETPAAA